MKEVKNHPWIKWTDKKPDEEQNILAIYYGEKTMGGYQIAYIGPVVISIINRATEGMFDCLYWVPLPE